MPKLLDLYSCAGGAGEGYRRAGFDVYSVDIADQPNNPFPFFRGDVLEVLLDLLLGGTITFSDGETLGLEDFHTIHASPPCQAYSVTKSKTAHNRKKAHVDLVAPTRDLLNQTGKPWIMENVVGAPLIDPVVLCGTQFGLVAEDVDGVPLRLLRHRLFESTVSIVAPPHVSHRKDSTLTASVFGSGGTYTPAHRDNRLRVGATRSTCSFFRLCAVLDFVTEYAWQGGEAWIVWKSSRPRASPFEKVIVSQRRRSRRTSRTSPL